MTETTEADDNKGTESIDTEQTDDSTPPTMEELQDNFLSEIRPHLVEISKALELETITKEDKTSQDAVEPSDTADEDCSEEALKAVLAACCGGKTEEAMTVLEHLKLTNAMQILKQLQTSETNLQEEEPEKENLAPPPPAEEPAPRKRLSHKEILDITKGTFIDTMKPTTALLQHLESMQVLNYETTSQILCRPSRPDRVKCLIELLMELGPKSLIVFIEGLKKTDQMFLANILASQVSQNFGP